jgi:hypothetical protein
VGQVSGLPHSASAQGLAAMCRAAVWKNYLLELLRQSEPRGR